MKIKTILLTFLVAILTLNCARSASKAPGSASIVIPQPDVNSEYTATWSNYGGDSASSFSLSNSTGRGAALPTSLASSSIQSKTVSGTIYSPLVVYSGNLSNQYVFSLEHSGVNKMTLRKYVYSELGELTEDTQDYTVPDALVSSSTPEAHHIALHIDPTGKPFIFVTHHNGVTMYDKSGEVKAEYVSGDSVYRILIDDSTNKVYFHTQSKVIQTDMGLDGASTVEVSIGTSLRALPMIISSGFLYIQAGSGSTAESTDSIYSVKIDDFSQGSTKITNGRISSLRKFKNGILYVLKNTVPVSLKSDNYIVSNHKNNPMSH